MLTGMQLNTMQTKVKRLQYCESKECRHDETLTAYLHIIYISTYNMCIHMYEDHVDSAQLLILFILLHVYTYCI